MTPQEKTLVTVKAASEIRKIAQLYNVTDKLMISALTEAFIFGALTALDTYKNMTSEEGGEF